MVKNSSYRMSLLALKNLRARVGVRVSVRIRVKARVRVRVRVMVSRISRVNRVNIMFRERLSKLRLDAERPYRPRVRCLISFINLGRRKRDAMV